MKSKIKIVAKLGRLEDDLIKLKNPQRAKVLARFFKTGKGQYGEGDIFWGITVPMSRKIAQKYKLSFSTNKDLSFGEIKELLRSKVHEKRLIALLILVHNFTQGGEKERKKIFDFYLKSTKYINNWDLVDLSADKIVGGYLLDLDKSILIRMARSKSIWERRIAIIATYQFIKERKEFEWTLKIAELLLFDKDDLIHKAVGWMLREVGKRDQTIEEDFLKKYYKMMPRTTLRYATERFDEGEREFYLSK